LDGAIWATIVAILARLVRTPAGVILGWLLGHHEGGGEEHDGESEDHGSGFLFTPSFENTAEITPLFA
jgi:hypothetical protein